MFWVRSLPSARKVKCAFFRSLTNLLEMPQYYYTGVSDQKLQYNKIKYEKKKNSHIFIITDIDDVFEITLPFHASNRRSYNTISFFYNSMPLKAQVEQWITKAHTRKTYTYLCEYVDVGRLIRAHGTSIQCPLIFELHCVYKNISLLLISTYNLHSKFWRWNIKLHNKFSNVISTVSQ